MSTPPPTPPAPPGVPAAWEPPVSPTPEDGPAAPAGRAPWPPVTALLVIVTGLGVAVLGGLIIGIVGVAFGADLENTPPSIAIISTVVQDACFIGAVVLFATRGQPFAPWRLGLRGTRPGRAAGWIALAFLAQVLISYAWTQVLNVHDKEHLPDSLGVDKSTAALVATAILVTVIAPVAEELMFRGYVFPALRNWRGTAPAVIITGLLFGTLHVLSSPAYALLPLSVFGALLCLLYLKTKSLYPGIVLHALNNCVAFGQSPEVNWGWQIPLLAVGALATIWLLGYGVRRSFGTPPADLSPV